MASPVKEAKLFLASNGFTEVTKRTKGGIEARIPGTNRKAMKVVTGNRGYHFGTGTFTEANEIDTEWQLNDNPSYAQYRYKMELADYNAYLGQDDAISFNAANIIKYVEPISGEELDIFPYPNLVYTNDLGQLQVIGTAQSVSGSVSGDLVEWKDAYGAGLDFQWQAQLVRLFKALIINDRTNLPDPEQFIFDGGNPVLRLELQFQKSSGLEIWVDGFLWDEKSNDPQTTNADIEFRSVDGKVLWRFKSPTAWDSEFESISPNLHVEKRANNLFVSMDVPWNWLDVTAIYPVTVDTVIDVATSASNEDASEDSSGNTLITGGTPTLDSTNPYMGYYFTLTSSIASGDTISESYTTITVVNRKIIDVNIYADDQDTPSVFSSSGNPNSNISGRTSTTATVTWSETVANNNTPYPSPSLNTIISELKTSGYLDDTGPVVLVHSDAGSCDWRVYHYDQGANYPELYIDFTTGADTVTLNTLTLASSAESLTVTPATATVSLNTLSLASSLESLTVTAGAATVITNELTLASSLESLTVVPTAVSLTLNELTLASTIEDIVVSSVSPQSVTLNELTLSSSLESLAVTSGAATVQLNELTLFSSLESLVVSAGVATVSLNELTLISSPESITIVPSANSVSLNELTLTSSIESITVTIGAVSVSLNELTLSSSAESITVTSAANSIALNELTLSSSAESITVTIGAVSVTLNELTLVSSVESLTVVPSNATISLNELVLTGSAEIIVISGSAVSISTNTLTLISSAESLSVIAGTATISLSELILVSSSESITISGAAVSVSLNELTLSSSAEQINVILGSVPQTVTLNELTLVSSAESISIVPQAISITLNELTLSSSAESITVSLGAVSITVSTLSLNSNLESLAVTAGAVTLSVNELTLLSSAEFITISGGAVTISTNELTLASSLESITIAIGAATVSLGELVLTSSVESISIVPSAASTTMSELLLASSAESLFIDSSFALAVNTLTLASSTPSITVTPSVASALMDTLVLVSTLVSLSLQAGALDGLHGVVIQDRAIQDVSIFVEP